MTKQNWKTSCHSNRFYGIKILHTMILVATRTSE